MSETQPQVENLMYSDLGLDSIDIIPSLLASWREKDTMGMIVS